MINKRNLFPDGGEASQAVWKTAADLAKDFLNTGNSDLLVKDNLDYNFLQSLSKFIKPDRVLQTFKFVISESI